MTRTCPDDPLQPVLPPTRAWTLLDAAATRALEQQALAARAPHALMARAGQAVARLLLATQPHARTVLALAGPGNNGGDAVVAATALHRHGLRCQVVLLADTARLPTDAAWALAEARAQGLPIALAWPEDLVADAALDGLLGLGAARAPTGALAAAIARLNASRLPAIAIDLPSGLDPDRGKVLGEQAVRAAHTLSLLALKPGLFTAEGRDHAGRVWLDTLGVDGPGAGTTPMTLLGPPEAPGPFGCALAAHSSHKGRFGDLSVIGGAPGMVGAAQLAARAALAAGAGRVYLGLLDAAAQAGDAAWPELMARALPALLEPAWLAHQTVVCGCGGGDAVSAALPPLLAHAARLVLDADALNAIAGDAGLRRALAAQGPRGRPTLITPHPLEAARLLGRDAATVQADRPQAARALAATLSCTAVLKGSGTLIATPPGRLAVNPTGNALLASAGTGDVLAGWMGGLWARVGDAAAPAEVAAAAVYRHGLAADRAAAGAAPPPALRAGELIEAMRRLSA